MPFVLSHIHARPFIKSCGFIADCLLTASEENYSKKVILVQADRGLAGSGEEGRRGAGEEGRGGAGEEVGGGAGQEWDERAQGKSGGGKQERREGGKQR